MQQLDETMSSWNDIPLPGLLALLAASATGPANPLCGAQAVPFNSGWQFHLGDLDSTPPYPANGPGWESLDLPHDWSITLPRSPEAPSDGGGGFFQTGVGIYQKNFSLPAEWAGKQVFVHFEGVVRECEVWLNGTLLGRNVNPYLPFRMRLDDRVFQEGPNTLTVVVDNSGEPSSRWYTGSGIYRPVWLEAVSPLHAPFGGLAVRTRSISADEAILELEGTVHNGTGRTVEAQLEFGVFDPDGQLAGQAGTLVTLAPGESKTVVRDLTISQPRPWSPDQPALYRCRMAIGEDGAPTDTQGCRFGIRTVEVRPGEGLFINGEPVNMLGANIHHDYGPIGAAVFPAAALRKARTIKEAGFNAVRTAHNPPSTAFLDACDEVGLLVMDEAFDTWRIAKVKYDYHRHFEENYQSDLRTLVLRDRNHPSVILWSTGNEMYDRAKDYAPGLSRDMSATIKKIDPSRPVTAGVNGLGHSGGQWPDLDPLFATFDIAGYNYELGRHADDHQRLPDRVMYASESFLNEVFINWKIITETPYVCGEFIWSGLDYLGEAGIGRVFPPDEKVRGHWEGTHWPWHGAACGDIDQTGFRKPLSHYRNIVWDLGETLYMAVMPPAPGGGAWQPSQWATAPFEANWTWPGREGESMTVEVYSRHERVRLLLNGKVVGESATGMDSEFKATFTLPYRPGQLTAEGWSGGTRQEAFSLVTAGDPAGIRLRSAKSAHRSDSSDIIYVDVQVTDASGRPNRAAELPLAFAVQGPARILTIGNGDVASEEAYGVNPRRTWQGRAQVVLRPTGASGDILLTATGSGLEPATILIPEK